MALGHSHASANVMSELYLQTLRRVGLLEPLEQVPFHIQRRANGFSPAVRCLSLLVSQAQGCHRLTDWTGRLRQDDRLCHWLGVSRAPHASTLSRSLAATDRQTVRTLRGQVLVPLSNRAFGSAEACRRWVWVDVDSKGIPAEGKTYEATAYGRMNDGTQRRGYRLHLLSLNNRWPLEMEFTGANAHGAPWGSVMIRRLMGRLPRRQQRRVVIRGDANYGAVRFVRFLQRYPCGYLLRGYNSSTARKLWERTDAVVVRRIARADRPDLLVKDCGKRLLTGMTRRHGRNGRQRRRACHVRVPRVVVYREDPRQAVANRPSECFYLITTLTAKNCSAEKLLKIYLHRGGDVENIFCQLDQAFQISHLRTRRFYGNYTFVLLVLIATILTQGLRERSLQLGLPIPPGLKETLVAGLESGLHLGHDRQNGCLLHRDSPTRYSRTFEKILRCSYQRCFQYAA
ncbi:MAG: transposase [Planctomycetales bacterium]|nr:transposase [Planctomycetales bacterium]